MCFYKQLICSLIKAVLDTCHRPGVCLYIETAEETENNLMEEQLDVNNLDVFLRKYAQICLVKYADTNGLFTLSAYPHSRMTNQCIWSEKLFRLTSTYA